MSREELKEMTRSDWDEQIDRLRGISVSENEELFSFLAEGLYRVAAELGVDCRWSVDSLVERVKHLRRLEEIQPSPKPHRTLYEVEREEILRVVKEVGNKALAARILGLDRRTLYRKLEKYELEDRRFILWNRKDGPEPPRGEDGLIDTPGAVGEISLANAYLKTYANYPEGSRNPVDLAIGECIVGVTYTLSAESGVYDVYRVR